MELSDAPQQASRLAGLSIEQREARYAGVPDLWFEVMSWQALPGSNPNKETLPEFISRVKITRSRYYAITGDPEYQKLFSQFVKDSRASVAARYESLMDSLFAQGLAGNVTAAKVWISESKNLAGGSVPDQAEIDDFLAQLS